MHWNQFPVMGYSFLTQEHYKQEILLGMSTFSKPPFWKSLQIVSCIIFTLLEFHRNSICIHCILVVISLGIGKTWAKDINFDKASVLKIITLPSSKISSLSHSENLFNTSYIFFKILPFSPLSVVLFRLLCILISLVLNLKTIKIKKLYSAILLLNSIF